MQKIIDISKYLDTEGFGIRINDSVTIYPMNNIIRIMSAQQLFSQAEGEGIKISDMNKILEMLYSDEDIKKLSNIHGFTAEHMMQLITTTLNHITGNDGDEVDSKDPNA